MALWREKALGAGKAEAAACQDRLQAGAERIRTGAVKKRIRNIEIKFFVSPEESNLIKQKMALLGTENLSAFIRKMAIDGQVINLEIPEFKEALSLLRHAGNNLNQLTKRVNANGKIYSEDLADLQISFDQLREIMGEICRRLAAIG